MAIRIHQPELQRVMAYLNGVVLLLGSDDTDSSPNIEGSHCVNTSDASMTACASTISQTSQTALTTASDQAWATAQAVQGPRYNETQFLMLLDDISRKVNISHFQKIFFIIQGALTTILPLSLEQSLEANTLKKCPNTDKIHSYDLASRCLRCKVQLCKVSYSSYTSHPGFQTSFLIAVIYTLAAK